MRQLAAGNAIGKPSPTCAGWPIWISQVRPGREHDTTAVRVHTEILPALAGDLRSLGDLGYEGESQTITVAFKTPEHGKLTTMQQRFNKARNGLRAIGERGNSLLKMTFRALRSQFNAPSRDRGCVPALTPGPLLGRIHAWIPAAGHLPGRRGADSRGCRAARD